MAGLFDDLPDGNQNSGDGLFDDIATTKPLKPARATGAWTDNLRDPAAGFLKIGPTAIKGVADIARLLTGDRIGVDTSTAMKEGMTSIDEVVGSDRLRQSKQAISEALRSPDVGLTDLPGVIIDNPRASIDAAISTIGSMFLPTGVAVGATKLLPAAGKIIPRLATATPGAVATGATIGTGAAQNAAETFADTAGNPLDDRYTGAGISAATSLVLGKILGGGAEGVVARRIAGDTLAGGIAQGAKSAVQTGAKEFAQEFGEEGSNYIGKQVAKSEAIDPLTGVKEAAYGGVVGFGVGGASDVATNAANISQGSIESQIAREIDRAAQEISDQPAPQVAQQTVAGIFADLPDTQAAAPAPAAGQPAPTSVMERLMGEGWTPPASEPKESAAPAQPAPAATEAAAPESQNVQDQASQPGPESQAQAAPSTALQVGADPFADIPAATLAGAAPAQAAGVKPYAKMNYEELDQAFNEALQSNDDIDLAAVRKHKGEAAAQEFGTLSRKKRDAWLDANASEEMDADTSAYKGVNEEAIKEHRRAVNDFDIESANALGRSIALKTKNISSPDYTNSPDYTTVSNAFSYAHSQGWSEGDVLAGMRGRAAEWAGSDAPELFSRLFKEGQSAKAETPASTPLQLAQTKPDAPYQLGRDNTPLAEGGKPFKTKLQAATAKKQQPMMRVIRVDGGFALADKTQKQLDAQDKAARRLSSPQTSPRGQAIAAHSFIADAGGLAPGERADMAMQGNVRIGNRTLFAGTGKGLTIERATEKLIEDGYLPEGAGHDQARALIKRSLTNPQYTPEGTERMAQAEAETRFEDHLAAIQEATAEDPAFDPFPANDGWLEADMQEAGYDVASPEIQAEVQALIAMADAAGIDSESLMLEAHDATRNGTTQEYYEQAKSALENAIARSSENRGEDAGQPSSAREQEPAGPAAAAAAEPAADGGLDSYTPKEVLARLAKLEQAQKDQQAADTKADAEAKKERDRKDIASRQDSSAENFRLGQSAEDSLSGQGSMFDEPAPAAPEPDQQARRATADLQNALADLGDIFTAKFKTNMMTPQQEAKLVPVLTRVLDAAFRLGYVKFKDAAKFALDQIRSALGAEVANSLTIDHLQGSYIAMAGGRPGADTKRAVIDVEDKAEIEAHTATAQSPTKEKANEPGTDGNVERDSGQPAAGPAVGAPVQNDAGDLEQGTGRAGGRPRGEGGSGQQDGVGVPAGGAPVAGESGNQRVSGRERQRDFADITTGADFDQRGPDIGIEGIPPESIPARQVEAVAEVRPAKPAQGRTGPVKRGDLADIKATLPQLLPGQHEDVKKAEDRFAKPTGYGMLFTNGTGTGKTFSGLGIAKRFALEGKTNTLMVVPDEKIADDWIESGTLLGLNITKLKDTKDAGKGIVITTYANLGENNALAAREWDLVIPDEAHSLMQSADGRPTTYLDNLRAITYHPDGAITRYSMLHAADIEQSKALHAEHTDNMRERAKPGTTEVQREALRQKNIALEAEMKPLDKKLSAAREAVRDDVKAKQGAARPRLAALTATPFAYEKTIDWANGYLFDYMDGYPHDVTSTEYNKPDPRQYYFQTRLGYSMRYGKLTEPDGSKVDRGLMQRQFNAELKKNGSLSGRMLDVPYDYDRRFVLVNSAIGNRIDEALAWINEQRGAADKGDNGFFNLGQKINDQFKYLQKRYLLEAIKATEVIPIVKAHMALGRKVVVFHDYKKGGGFNPFQVPAATPMLDGGDMEKQRVADFNKARTAFNQKFSALVNLPLADMDSPIEVFKRELPDTMLVNGNEKRADLLKRYKLFQNDTTGPQVMLVQSAKNKGWSGHDTTGKHQRVLINLGQPTAPTLAIQQEGRIYRTGQASDAIMRYLNTGTDWERMTFASVIASRASTSENLGMGEMARALKDSFIQSFEETDTYAPGHEGEGKGGKERDKAANDALTEFDRARSHYWATQKKTSRNKAQEGTDYFATPEPVGLKMVQWLDSRPGEDTLEPSAGHGAIARWLPDTTKRTVIEPSMALRSRLALVMDANITRMVDGTFEEHATVNKYDGIVMNPPFGSGGRTAIDHMAKAATHLRDGGRLVALIPTGPAADAKFDKWFYDGEEQPAKPLQTRTGMQKVYAGDTINHSGGAFTAVSTGRAAGSSASSDFVSGADGERAYHGTYSVVPGPRTAKHSAADTLYMVADIKMPQVTFERAGTAVATRILVLEKHAKESDAPRDTGRRMDLSAIDDINELFSRIEHIDLPARTNAREVEAEPAPTRTAKPDNAPAPAAAPAGNGDSVTLDGKPYTVTTYTTNAGKELRGVWVETKAQALTHGPSTFEKRGQGFFVRERDFPKAGATATPAKEQFSRAAETSLSTAASVRAALNTRFGKLIERIENRGFLQVWDSAEQFNQYGQRSEQIEGAAQGMWDGKTAHLFADGIAQGDEVAVMLHEVGEHASMQTMLGTQQYDRLVARAHDLMYADDPIALAAVARIPDDTAEEFRNSELLAYMIETVVSQGERATPTARKWLADVAAAIRAWWYLTPMAKKLLTYGVRMELTPKDIAALAVRAVYWKGEQSVQFVDIQLSRPAPAAAAGGRARPLPASSSWTAPPGSPPVNPNTGAVTPQPWNVAEPGTMDNFVRAIQNNKIDLKRVREAIEAQAGPLPAQADAYLNEELYHGKVSARVTALHEQQVEPILKKIAVAGQNAGITLDDVNQYLHARHAPERNAAMQAINPGMANNAALSGMSDADAAQVMADFTAAGKTAGLANIAADVDQLLRDTRTGLVADGLEDAGTVQAWEQAYQHYAPLQRDIKSSGTPKGQGISIRGPEAKRAVGSDKEVVNILANIVAQAETAAIRAEKAIVGRALLDMARQYPNPAFWKVDAAPTKPRIDKETGLVIRGAIDPMFQTADNVVMVKDYGMEHFIVFEKNSERAMSVAKAMKNIDIAPMNKILEVASKGTRFIASLLTQRNPLFWMTNFSRDIQGAMINLQGTDAEGLQDKVLGNLPKAFKGMQSLVRGTGTGQWARYAREIQEAGGTTGYMTQFENSDKRMDDLKKIVAQMQQGKADPRRLARAALDFVDDYNDIIENAVRLSVFQSARDNGVSTVKAASIAKNITVNFNRKGNLSPPINALYMFFNASVQGTARLVQAIATSRSAQVLVGSIAVMGFLLDAMNRAMSDDDEETGRNRYDMIPEFEKSKNWIFMNPMRPGEYVKVPLPLGPHVFHNAGRLLSDATFRKDKRNAAEYGWSMASTVFDAFSPLGVTPSVGQLIAPSILDPVLQVAENKSFTGGPVYRSDDMGFGKTNPKPAYTRHFESTPDVWKAASRGLNDLTGGDKDKPGRLNVEPDILKHVFYAMTGGPGRMVDQTTDTFQSQARGDTPSVNRVPFVSRFYGENDDRQRQRVYYDDRKRAADAKTNHDYFAKIGRADLAREVAEDLGDGDAGKGRRMMHEFNSAQSSVSKINKQIRHELQRQENGEDRAKELTDLKKRRVTVMGGAGRAQDDE